jgi:hypothetical protein
MSDEERRKCTLVYHYSVAAVCENWYSGDSRPLCRSLPGLAKPGLDSDTSDTLLELATAYGHMLNIAELTTMLGSTAKSGDLRQRMRQINGRYPNAFEIIERKLVRVMRIATSKWERDLAEQHLDRLNELRR